MLTRENIKPNIVHFRKTLKSNSGSVTPMDIYLLQPQDNNGQQFFLIVNFEINQLSCF